MKITHLVKKNNQNIAIVENTATPLIYYYPIEIVNESTVNYNDLLEYAVLLVDVDPDTGFISQTIVMAYSNFVHIDEIVDIFNTEDDSSPNRNYIKIKL